jgi:CheY-like chemotaxis protein
MDEWHSRILVVEDDRGLRDLYACVLEDEEYEVRTAADGVEAWDVLQNWRPDLILLDLRMPRMDGPTFRARQLARADLARIPVVVLSSTVDDCTRASLRPDGVLVKPCDLETLLDVSRQAIERQAHPDAHRSVA